MFTKHLFLTIALLGPVSLVTSVPNKAAELTLTTSEANRWLNTEVYDNAHKHVGYINSVTRGSNGIVVEIEVRSGGFLGIDQKFVRIKPDQFTLSRNGVILNMSKSAFKTLHIMK